MSEKSAARLMMVVNVLLLISFYFHNLWVNHMAILLWIVALFLLLINNYRTGKSRFMSIAYGILILLAIALLVYPWLYI